MTAFSWIWLSKNTDPKQHSPQPTQTDPVLAYKSPQMPGEKTTVPDVPYAS